MVATRGRTFKRPWRGSCHSSKLKSSSAPIGRKDSWCFHGVGSSNAPLLGSTAAEGLQRIGRTSIATRWRFCGLPQSASCSENFVIPPDVFGQTLRKPGWLPTAIVVNILQSTDELGSAKVAPKDVVSVEENHDGCHITLPYSHWSKDWRPAAVPPLEVIDGQHRLWAFENDLDADFELPVVAFHGLDVSWQAYLFWTINIKPKRINPSLAFDLYPLLRSEDWLDRAEGHPIYRETRSQELTEALWSHPESPWYDRINMLGERQNPWLSQSPWIKALMATFVRPWRGRGSTVGGLFGSRLREGEEVLGWSRAQQASFLIFAWQQLLSAVQDSNSPWAKQLRSEAKRQQDLVASGDDPAFYGPHSLIVTDQGVRGYLHIVNDLCFVAAPKLELRSWRIEREAAASDANAVTLALK